MFAFFKELVNAAHFIVFFRATQLISKIPHEFIEVGHFSANATSWLVR
jgi:hypothetical protein